MSETPARSRAQQAYEITAKGIESVRDAEIKLKAQEGISHGKIIPFFLPHHILEVFGLLS